MEELTMGRNVHMTPEDFEKTFSEAVKPMTRQEEFEMAWYNLRYSEITDLACKQMMALLERIYNDLARPNQHETLRCLAEQTLKLKAKEYAIDNNRLYNFNRNVWCQDACESPSRKLMGYMEKQLISVHDILTGKLDYTPAMLKEKLGDVYNYCILLYAIAVAEEEGLRNE